MSLSFDRQVGLVVGLYLARRTAILDELMPKIARPIQIKVEEKKRALTASFETLRGMLRDATCSAEMEVGMLLALWVGKCHDEFEEALALVHQDVCREVLRHTAQGRRDGARLRTLLDID